MNNLQEMGFEHHTQARNLIEKINVANRASVTADFRRTEGRGILFRDMRHPVLPLRDRIKLARDGLFP
jgi:hypothetical protein